ncbi:MAG: hypothetical protein JNM69_10120 [Archangium sp.]|nr:hypothetical protein [Archangium sp.]
MSLQLILSFVFIFTSALVLGAVFVRMTARNAAADLRFGILATGGGAVMLFAVGLLHGTFGEVMVLGAIQALVALGIGGFRLLRHFRHDEFRS